MDHSSHHNHASHSHDIVPNTDPVEHRGMDSDFGTLIDDHGGHGGGSGAGNSPHAMMMAMWFHFGVKETILFEFWKTSEIGTLLGSIAVIFLLSFSYEALKFYREHLYRKSFRTIQYNTVTVPVENGGTVKETQKTVQVKMVSWMHTWQTFLHMVQVVISYFLMLIFMTYNVWLCLAVVLGAGSGYFFFGWKKSLVVDITEHCH